MKRGYLLALAVALASGLPESAMAYVGPGAGITAIGTVLALVAAVLFAAFGFLWYPLKRWSRRRNAGDKSKAEAGPSQSIKEG